MKKLIVLVSLLIAPLISLAGTTSSLSIEPLGQDQYLNYNFGRQFVNSRRYVDFTLTAKGPDATVIKEITIGGSGFSADTDCPNVLSPGKSCITRVYFWPPFEGDYWGNLNFYLNDGNIYVRLLGQAVR